MALTLATALILKQTLPVSQGSISFYSSFIILILSGNIYILIQHQRYFICVEVLKYSMANSRTKLAIIVLPLTSYSKLYIVKFHLSQYTNMHLLIILGVRNGVPIGPRVTYKH